MKSILKVFCALVHSTIFFLLLNCGNDLGNQIPEIPDLSNASESLKTQITVAHETVSKKASSTNLGELGMIYYSSNFYNQAKSCFDLARKAEIESWEWSYYKGLIHMELGESVSALNEMKTVIQENPKVWIAWYRLADIYKQMDSIDASIETLKKIINLSDDDTRVTKSLRSTYFPLQLHARLLLSKVYMSANEKNNAEKELKYLTSRYKTFGAPYRQLGILYANDGNTKLSKKYNERAGDLVEINEPLDTLQDNLALISRSENFVLKQIDIARNGTDSKWSYELIQNALTNMPDSKYVLSKAISQYLSQGTGKLATPLLNKHFNEFKEDYNEIFKTAVELANAGFRTEALRYFNHVAAFESNTDEQLTNIAGMYLEKLGMVDKASVLMEKVANRNLSNPDILGDAVFLILQINQPNKAKMYYNALKKIDVNNSSVKIYEAIQLEKNGNIEKAIDYYIKAFNSDTKNKYVIGHIKDLLMKKQAWRKAESFFRKALLSYPNDSELQMYLGWVLISYPKSDKIEEIKEGIEYSERAFYNCRYKIGDRVSAGRTLAVGFHLLKNNKLALNYINRTIGIATNAKFDSNYIQGLKNLSQQFSR